MLVQLLVDKVSFEELLQLKDFSELLLHEDILLNARSMDLKGRLTKREEATLLKNMQNLRQAWKTFEEAPAGFGRMSALKELYLTGFDVLPFIKKLGDLCSEEVVQQSQKISPPSLLEIAQYENLRNKMKW